MKSVDDELVVVGKEEADLIELDADMSVIMRLRSRKRFPRSKGWPICDLRVE
tara:strand:+ start:8526 stop:8681 length:156 start_codon:yes stop_codon:yes gene_type:complete